MKREMLEVDKKKCPNRCLEKTHMVAEVSRRIGWAWLWDAALDLGWKTVKGLQLLSKALSHHRRGSHPSYLYDTTPPSGLSMLDLILASHLKSFILILS